MSLDSNDTAFPVIAFPSYPLRTLNGDHNPRPLLAKKTDFVTHSHMAQDIVGVGDRPSISRELGEFIMLYHPVAQ